MKKISVLVATVIVAMGITSCGDSHKSASLKTAADSVSYAIGISTGAGYKENLKTLPGDPANVDDLIAGFIQAIKGDSSAMKMTPQAAQAYVQTYFMEASARDAKKTKEEGEKFLAENKTKKDVITTESGLQYQVVTEGKGAKPTADDKVKVHYTGTLLDGTKFDSTMDRGGEPAEFPVGGVIKGWTEVLQLMPVGSKYIVWVPSELAYGERGAGQDIKPNSTLKFEIELLDIVKDLNMYVRSFCCALLHSQEAVHEQWCQAQSDRQDYVSDMLFQRVEEALIPPFLPLPFQRPFHLLLLSCGFCQTASVQM